MVINMPRKKRNIKKKKKIKSTKKKETLENGTDKRLHKNNKSYEAR